PEPATPGTPSMSQLTGDHTSPGVLLLSLPAERTLRIRATPDRVVRTNLPSGAILGGLGGLGGPSLLGIALGRGCELRGSVVVPARRGQRPPKRARRSRRRSSRSAATGSAGRSSATRASATPCASTSNVAAPSGTPGTSHSP